MSATDTPSALPARTSGVVIVADWAESVLRMQQDESRAIETWLAFIAAVRGRVLPGGGARLVKSLGDGLMLTCADIRAAVATALALHAVAAEVSQSPAAAAGGAIALRVGLHGTEYTDTTLDIYGAGVNLAARVAALAQPGQVVATAEVRDALIDGVDAEIEDLGPCYLKHVEGPVRVFRLGRVGAGPAPLPEAVADRPTLLVVPPEVLGDGADTGTLGDVVAADLTAHFGRCALWNVVARISADSLKGRHDRVHALAGLARADYVLSCRLQVRGAAATLEATLFGADAAEPLWADAQAVQVEALLAGTAPALDRITEQVAAAIVGVELRRADSLSLPTLRAYSILFGAIAALHRTATDTVARARQGLEHIIERHPREPEAHAWAARSHVLSVAQGSALGPQEHARRARDHIRRALELRPAHALALAVEGLVRLFIERDLAGAETSYAQALASNPNEPLAWLFMASVHAHREDGRQALACVGQAARLLPFDTMGHYLQGVTAWSLLAAGDAAGAERHALGAMRQHCTHRPTLMTLTQAQALQGRGEAARASAQRLMAIAPGLTASQYLRSFPGGETPYARRLAQALQEAGVPP